VTCSIAIGFNLCCRIHEPGRDPGFGQSILHEGQLVFRTPPYGPVQETGSNVGNPKATGGDGVKV